ncbi:Xaa-Pro peptidase family protein [Bosea sp. (in: a-proteobacteria)]|uniref:M24 family metallopeptidase n=1 Tax=Bosea sp. (in: a-proteobacteria) TaxID=1871050 RepID=UPI002DDCA288|nr:Xaa-Pro peptidase family protein [Bosea sp. (in: a-proteobacteria)]HEV2510328.1 Xaa-Pro peptidase family protein [Bosea sp. (in: a-proteobacteria)]
MSTKNGSTLPFDAGRLDRIMDETGIDVLLVTSKHNVQYLLGGHRSFFFDYMDAIGTSRYLPVLVYPKGRPEDAAYIGSAMEGFEKALGRFWPPTVQTASWGSEDALKLACEHVGRIISPRDTIGIEMAFLPYDAGRVLHDAMGNRRVLDATFALERLRLIKTPEEMKLLRQASDAVIASIGAVFDASQPGMTKNDLVAHLRNEEVSRGLNFEYCLITSGTELNRAPSDRRIEPGDILSLDSGGNYRGYIGDLCRMGIVGEPDAELSDLLDFIEDVQMAARRPIRPGTLGGEIFALAEPLIEASGHKAYTEFVAHGMGLVSHEGPRLTGKGVVPYEGYDEDRPLEAGMVLSIETTMKHPVRGYVKIEDTVVVTADGWEGLGDSRRGWNRVGR